MLFRRLAAAASGAALAMSVGATALADTQSARALEARLYAPCCYAQTLDVHESEIAHELRTEIEERLAKGESSAAVEASIVERYGPKIRAISDGAAWIVPTVGLALSLPGAAILIFAIRRRRPPGGPPGKKPPPAPRDALDGRIDDELESLD